MRVLAVRQHCWQCGYLIAGPVYVISTEQDNNHLYGDLYTQAFGPLHRSCALYAALACPFLRYPKSRRRIGDRSPRGTASIQGFNHCGAFFPPSPITFMCFGYFSATETIPLTDHARIAELYEKAVSVDAATGFTRTPRLSWTDSADDVRRLTDAWSEEKQKLQAWARTSVVTIDGRTYRGHALDQSRAGV